MAHGGTLERTVTWLLVGALSALGSGCVRVQPYERGILAARVMRPEPDPRGAQLDTHVHEYREGSIGGTGVSGGGCGCN